MTRCSADERAGGCLSAALSCGPFGDETRRAICRARPKCGAGVGTACEGGTARGEQAARRVDLCSILLIKQYVIQQASTLPSRETVRQSAARLARPAKGRSESVSLATEDPSGDPSGSVRAAPRPASPSSRMQPVRSSQRTPARAQREQVSIHLHPRQSAELQAALTRKSPAPS